MKHIYTYFLWIDDVRPAPISNYHQVWSSSYHHAIHTINHMIDNGHSIIISFDHDLGFGKSGYDVAKYIVENQLPQDRISWRVHSANPVGVANITQLLTHYGYPRAKEEGLWFEG